MSINAVFVAASPARILFVVPHRTVRRAASERLRVPVGACTREIISGRCTPSYVALADRLSRYTIVAGTDAVSAGRGE